jgi:hypothetical protein
VTVSSSQFADVGQSTAEMTGGQRRAMISEF